MAIPLPRPTFTPSVCYRDPMAAIEWLARAFGFERSMLITDDAGKLQHAEMQYGGGLVMIGWEWTEQARSPASIEGCNTQSIHVHLNESVEPHFARAKAAGAAIVRDLSDEFYGDRVYIAADLEGHRWSFAETKRYVSREEAEQASGLKIDGWI